MLKAFLFLLFMILLILIQLLLPKYLLFIPILSIIGLFISPKWSIGFLFTFGIWLDSLYSHPFVIPYTILLVLLGVSIELLRSRFSKKLHIFGFYIVLLFSFLLFFVNIRMEDLSLYLLGRLLLVLVMNVIVYYISYGIWLKINK